MTLSLRTETVIFLLALVSFSGLGSAEAREPNAAAPEPVVSMNRYDSVKSAVLLNGESKKVNGQQYRLVTIYFTPLFWLQARDDAYTGWLVNGRRLSEIALKDPATTQPFTDLAKGLMTVWLPMDENGKIEILYGVVNLSDAGDAVNDPASLQSELIRHFIPFSAEKLASVEADRTSSLLETFKKVAYPRQPIFSVASVNGLKKNIDGKQYRLLAIHFDITLSSQINNSLFLGFNIWNERGTCDFKSENGELDFKGKRPYGLKFVWVEVDNERDSKLIFRYQLVDGNRIDRRKNKNEQIEKLMSVSPGFVVDLKELPEVNGKTYLELANQMLDLLPAQFPNPPSADAKTANDADQISLVDWVPVNSETISGVVTLRFPIPDGLAWNNGGYVPAQGGPTPRQRWEGQPANVSIEGVALNSLGRQPRVRRLETVANIPDFNGLHITDKLELQLNLIQTHYDASFVVPKSIQLTDAEIKHLQSTVSFNQQTLRKKKTSLRCSYSATPVLTRDLEKTGSTRLVLRCNKVIDIEQVKIGNFKVKVRSNGSREVFVGVTSAKLRESESKISIKLRGHEGWISFEYQMPYVHIEENQSGVDDSGKPINFFNPTSFQIIGPGMDGRMSDKAIANTNLADSAAIDSAQRDNITNFSGGRLERSYDE